MKATAILNSEHRIVEEMLELLGHAAGRLQSGESVNLAAFEKAIDFCRGFVDKCHHAKEERHLFPELVRKGMSEQGGPVGAMLSEHEQGRAHIRAMAEALAGMQRGDHAAIEAMAHHAEEYVALLKAHVEREDGVLFPMADRILTLAEHEALEHQFELVELEEMGEGVHERYHHMIEEVRAELTGVTGAAGHKHHH